MANESYSVYPYDLDGYSTLPLRRDGIHEIVAADHNRLRDAIVKIEQELGIQPSGTFSTVASRLDDIGDAKAQILAHMADPTDAHDASAISIADADDHYFGVDVEAALEELATLLPPLPDEIGENNGKVPNDGIPSFVDGYGTKFIFNVSSADAVHKRTQPSTIPPGIRGVHVFEVSPNTPEGDGYMRMTGGVGAETLEWMAPGDSSYGDAVDISAITEGEALTVSSSDTSKQIKITRNSVPLGLTGGGELVEHFEVYSLNAVEGYYSLPSEGFKYSRFISRTAKSINDPSNLQCMIGGMVFPADRGTIVLQRKLRGVSSFFPVAMLNLTDIFDDDVRNTGQKVYAPSLDNFDVITLYDRYPLKEDYTLVPASAGGDQPYDNFENDFNRMQVAKYLIPLSNGDIVGGALTTPEGVTETEANDNVSAFRIIHYKETVDDTSPTFGKGNPDPGDIYSVTDATWGLDDHDLNSTVRMSNVYMDSSQTRPGIELLNLRPEPPDITTSPWYPSVDGTTMRSGVRYYNSSADKFEIELRSDNNVFNKTYVVNNILTFETDVFNFPNGIGDGYWGAQVDIQELTNDGYLKWNDSNLPGHEDQAFYIVNDFTLINGVSTNATRMIYPAPDRFSTHANITATLHDPFGPGDGYTSFGAERINRIMVNSYDVDRATDTIEYFTDEYKRNADTEEYTTIGSVDGYSYDAFDSSSVLATGSLQVGGRWTSSERNIPGLIYPQDNYKSVGGLSWVKDIIRPSQNNDALMNYSLRQGDLTYRRLFTLGYPISSGKLRIVSGGDSPISFEDIRFGNSDRFARVEIKIPGHGTNSTGWLDIGRLYETNMYFGRAEAGLDGYGALSGAVTGSTGDFTVPFTFGPRNTAEVTNYAFALKVTYFGDTEAQREVSKQKILTMIQLLPS